jgi:hypothetical protein
MNSRTHHQHEEIIIAVGHGYRCLFRREVDSGYSVTCAELPPMLAFGETLDEARTNLPLSFVQVKRCGQKRRTLRLQVLRFTWRILARFTASSHFGKPDGCKAAP